MIDWKGLAILRCAVGRPPLRFSDFQRVVQNPRTLALKLKKMQAEGLLVRENGLYKLTPTGEEAAKILESYQRLVGGDFSLKNLDRVPHIVYLPLLRDYCELLWGRYRDRLEGVVLFGSVARGDWKRESDIDLLVVVQGWREIRDWERIEELSPLKNRLARRDSQAGAIQAGFYPAIHVLPLSPEEMQSFRPLYLDIATDGIVLFDKEGLMSRFVGSVREEAERAGAKRVVSANGSFYWSLTAIRLGEVVTLGH